MRQKNHHERPFPMSILGSAVAAAVLLIAGSSGAAAKPVLEATTQKFIDSLAGTPPIYKLTPGAARKLLHDTQSGPIMLPKASVEDRIMPVGPKSETRVRIIRPQGMSRTLPVIIYFHGGGWIMGDTTTHDRLVRQLAVGAQALVVFVDYDRSPEARYPIAIEEDFGVTKYVAEHPAEFNVDASRLAIAGDSVGGNMTAVVALLAKERGGPAIAAQLLFFPVTDASMNNLSYNTGSIAD